MGPARPGRIDVAKVSDLPVADGSAREDATSRDAANPAADISPMWSELLDTTGSNRPVHDAEADPDAPLLDDTTLGGRRARRYDMQQDIDEITEGGGGIYRGRRARRRPDSA